jgi:hypothetical protein
MKKYIELQSGDTLSANDERVSNKGYETIEAEAIGTTVDRFHEQYKIFRRPVPHTGDVQFLMCVSVFVPVIVNCDGREQESIEAEAGELAYQKVLDDPRKYISYDNVDWKDCKVDEIQPEPKNPGKYRYLELDEVIEANDELFKIDLAQFEPISNGFEWLIGAKFSRAMNQVRRPITEPQYRPFRLGDVIEKGDQYYHLGAWYSFQPSTIGREIDMGFWRESARKLIK